MDYLNSLLKNIESGKQSPDDACDVIIADIRNKLSPILNLVALIENNADVKWINEQLSEVKKSIEYLSDKNKK